MLMGPSKDDALVYVQEQEHIALKKPHLVPTYYIRIVVVGWGACHGSSLTK